MSVHDSPEPVGLRWQWSGKGEIIVCRSGGRKLCVPLDPILLIAIHSIIFTFVFPRLDLPVSDDANYFGYGKIFARNGTALYGDWSPLLTYFIAALFKVLPLSWYGLFTGYAFLCRLILLLGIHALIDRFTDNRRWSFFTTLFAAVCFNYWLQENARAFTSGVLLYLLAWLARKEFMDVWTGVSVVLLSVLLRPEFGLLVAGFAAVPVWRAIRQRSWFEAVTPNRITFVLIALMGCSWTPLLMKGHLDTGRLDFAFAQKFRDFAIEHRLLENAGLDPVSHWDDVVDVFFPPERRDTDSWLPRIIPLYETVSANPALFGRFVWSNARPFVTARFRFCQSRPLSFLINVWIHISFLAFAVQYVTRFRRPHDVWLVFYSVLFALAVFPCLLTRPFRDYIFPTVIWFFAVIPYRTIGTFSFKRYVLIGWLLVAVAFQIPVWKDVFEDNRPMNNWKRAILIRDASNSIGLTGAAITEAYPVFCVAFSEAMVRSVHYYNVSFDGEGVLRANKGRGPVIDFVLFEENPPGYLLKDVERLKESIAERSEIVMSRDGFTLIRILPPVFAPPDTVIVTGGPHSRRDLSGVEYVVRSNERELTLIWNFGDRPHRDVHIYVSVDGAKYEYLGRTGSDKVSMYRWKSGTHLLETPFADGPQFVHTYRFKVFAIPPRNEQTKPFPLESVAPVHVVD